MTRQKVDPATRAQAALDVAVRKLDRHDAAEVKAVDALAVLRQQRAALAADADYAAQHPALRAPDEPADNDEPIS